MKRRREDKTGNPFTMVEDIVQDFLDDIHPLRDIPALAKDYAQTYPEIEGLYRYLIYRAWEALGPTECRVLNFKRK